MNGVTADEALNARGRRREDRGGNAPVQLPRPGAAADGAELHFHRCRVCKSLFEDVEAWERRARLPVAECAEVLMAADGVVIRTDERLRALTVIQIRTRRCRRRDDRRLRRGGLGRRRSW